MSSRPDGDNSIWVIVAFPAAVLVLLLAVALITIALRPAKKPAEKVAVRSTVRPPVQAEPPVVEPARPPSPPPVAVEAMPLVTSGPTTSTAVRSIVPQPVAPLAGGASPPPIDLLTALDLDASRISGDWRKDGGAIRCDNASAKNRAKLRLVAPTGGGYDFAITFTAEGGRRVVAQVLSFRGRQFSFVMFSNQSGFATVHGRNAVGNETTKNKGIKADTKHTSLIKVRDHEVSAFLDGELLSTYTTDYSDLDLAKPWTLGPSSARENVLGLATECPVTVEAITLTPMEAQPATAPMPPTPASSYRDLATMISSPFSGESSAAATQPAEPRRVSSGALQTLVATSQPVISEVAADLLKNLGEAAPGATRPAGVTVAAANNDAEALFRAVQLSISPAGPPPDPLLESQATARSSPAIDRGEFDAEQARNAAWRTLISRIGDFYPNARPMSDIVKLQLSPADGADAANAANPAKPPRQKPASFFATHSQSEPLTNVTLELEIVHAMTSPSPTAVHRYFIPRWAPGQKIFFPAAACIPNVPSRELLESAGPSPSNTLSGLVEARAQLWSDKLAQPKQATRFDANFQAIARAQLDEAYRLVDEALRRPAATSRPAGAAIAEPQQPSPSPMSGGSAALIAGPIVPPRADLDDAAPELARARAAARRALDLLPPQSPLADEAGALDAQPRAALRELRKRQVDAFIAALPLRSSRSGVWVIHKPGMLARMVRPADRDAALAAAGVAGGRLTFTLDSRTSDGSAVAVTLTSADQPDLHRKFTGRLQADASSANRLLLNLRATQPPPTRAPAEGDLKRVVYWTSLLLELRGNSLCGIATAGPTDASTVLNVAFAAPDPTTPIPATGRSLPKPHQRPTTRAK